MTREQLQLLKDVAELGAELVELRAENKLLREDRDSWKAMAERLLSARVSQTEGERHD